MCYERLTRFVFFPFTFVSDSKMKVFLVIASVLALFANGASASVKRGRGLQVPEIVTEGPENKGGGGGCD